MTLDWLDALFEDIASHRVVYPPSDPKADPDLATLDGVIFFGNNYIRDIRGLMPEEERQKFFELLREDKIDPRMIWQRSVAGLLQQDREDQDVAIAHYLCYQKSYECARRLGYVPREDIVHLWEPVAVLDMVEVEKGEDVWRGFQDRIGVMCQKYQIDYNHELADAMWQVLIEKRFDDETVIQLCGDDRGRYEHFIVVRWLPQHFVW